MPRYMIQFSYTPEAWTALVRNPADRTSGFRGLVEKLGGRFISLDYCFGDYDGIAIFEAPDSSTATSVVLAAMTPGHLKATRTTELFTPQEMVKSLRTAGSTTYEGPR